MNAEDKCAISRNLPKIGRTGWVNDDINYSVVSGSQRKGTQRKLETKASSHAGQCIPAGYCHAHMLLYASGVNYNVNSKYTKYFAQPCRRFFLYVLSYFHHKLATLVAPPTDGTIKCLVRCKWHLVLQQTAKKRRNLCIIADAILSQTGTKLTKKTRF